MIELLENCLHSLSVLLEIQLSQQITDSIKLIEELLIYLATLINIVPTKSINCIRHLLKYMFKMNFMNRCDQYEYLIKNQFLKNENEVFVYVREFNKFKNGVSTTAAASSQSPSITTTMKTNEIPTPPSPSTSFKLVGIGISSSPSNDSKRMENGNNIKLFETIVIQCLKVRIRIYRLYVKKNFCFVKGSLYYVHLYSYYCHLFL